MPYQHRYTNAYVHEANKHPHTGANLHAPGSCMHSSVKATPKAATNTQPVKVE